MTVFILLKQAVLVGCQAFTDDDLFRELENMMLDGNLCEPRLLGFTKLWLTKVGTASPWVAAMTMAYKQAALIVR